MTPNKIDENVLKHFTGSETLHRFNSLSPNTLLTDGALYVAQEGGAFWLMDVIASAQIKPLVKAEPFQVWKLSVLDDHTGYIEADDGNGLLIYKQTVDFTDFRPKFIELYAVADGTNLIIMLPSEY